MTETIPGCAELIRRLDASVAAGGLNEITQAVKHDLEDLLGRSALVLPERLRTPRPDCYARRLLHRDPAGRYAAIVMTWGVGQGTSVHDHGGLWCVEGVVEGSIAVTQYDVTRESDGFFRAEARTTMTAGVGSAGRLIPPVDYHVISNALTSAPSITLHVYGGDLNRCRVFTPTADGRYTEAIKSLAFHD